MHVDTMRRIDRWAGVPLTFLLTQALRIKALLRPSLPVRAQRVLCLELSEMGSTILADPAMRKLKRELGCELYFAIFASNRASLELLRTIPDENIFTLRADNLRMFDDAARVLRPGGRLWCVFNSHLPYRKELNVRLGRTQVAAQDPHYTVTVTTRR